ncbi:MAG: hypothetical protein ACRDQD_28740 [Nocardioidaceae bacterium]
MVRGNSKWHETLAAKANAMMEKFTDEEMRESLAHEHRIFLHELCDLAAQERDRCARFDSPAAKAREHFWSRVSCIAVEVLSDRQVTDPDLADVVPLRRSSSPTRPDCGYRIPTQRGR